ncbi:hypothetical protein SDC9_201170 [bioreactor metagenome]|uniref:Uncharacterized protein n=1 Tax=bioreactor metagenome TaxID=1076179 RepID=A0A645IQX6_9ZZZZ
MLEGYCCIFSYTKGNVLGINRSFVYNQIDSIVPCSITRIFGINTDLCFLSGSDLYRINYQVRKLKDSFIVFYINLNAFIKEALCGRSYLNFADFLRSICELSFRVGCSNSIAVN